MTPAKKTIPLFKVLMSPVVIKPLKKVLFSGYIGEGQKVLEFEKVLQKFLDNPYVVTLNCGTSALMLAFRLIKGANLIKEGEEVLTTAFTCTATNWPILASQLKIKWVDVDLKTCNLDLADLERKISPQTKAIVVVHWSGYPLELKKLKQIRARAEKKFGFKPFIIEDACHAFGAEYEGKKIGSRNGNMTTFSFGAIKELSCGDGGLLTLPNKSFYRQAKLLRWYGMDREKSFECRWKEDIKNWGYKFHMNNISAAIGLANFPAFKKALARQRSNAAYYNQHLQNIPGLTLLENKPNRRPSSWLYTILVDKRPRFIKMMTEKGINVSEVHGRNDTHFCVKRFRSPLPNLDKLVQRHVCIPVGWWVTPQDRAYIVKSIKSGW